MAMLEIPVDIQEEVRVFVQPEHDVSLEEILKNEKRTSALITAVDAREHARILIANAFNSLETITSYQNAKKYRVNAVKQKLKELRDASIDEETRKTYDNFYRTAHLQIGNKVRKLSGHGNENILPLLLSAGVVSGVENKKGKKRIDSNGLLFYFIIGSAMQNKYSSKQIEQLLEESCKGSFLTNDMRKLQPQEITYIREKIIPNIDGYKDEVTNYLNKLGREITPPPLGIPERRNLLDRGLQVLERRCKENEKPVLEYANKVFLAYHMHEHPTEPGIERSDPRRSNPIRISSPEIRQYYPEKSVFTDALEQIFQSSAPVPIYIPKKTGNKMSLAKIVTAAGALATGFVLAIGIGIFSYFNREKESVEEAVVSYSATTSKQEEKDQEPVAEIKLQQQTQIIYEPQTAPVYNPKDPDPWYQIEKAELSADGSSLELKLGEDLIVPKDNGQSKLQIRVRYQTQEGKIKTNYKASQEKQTLHVDGKILDVGVVSKTIDAITYYSSVKF